MLDRFLLPFFLTLVSVLMFSCGPQGAPVLERENLFSLDPGTLEDEMDIFTRPEAPFRDKNRFVLHDGRFFIMNGQAKKVMEFTSYGVLITLHYNPDTNPQPVALGLASNDGQLRNRKAVTHYFHNPGELALNRRKQLYVEDRLPEDRRSLDEDLGAMLDRVILRFDTDGTYLDHLGQEGIGGTPFPLITSLQVTQNDEVVVVSRTQKFWAVWWFDKDHIPVFTGTWSLDQIPLPADRPEAIVTCAQIIPDLTSRRLYFDVGYYERTEDGDTGARTGIGSYQNRVLYYSVDRNEFFSSLILPKYFRKHLGVDGSESEVEYPYGLVGVTASRDFFFVSATDQGESRLLIMAEDGRVVAERTLKIREAEQRILLFHLDPAGVLSSLLSDGQKIQAVWWRSDRLVNISNAAPFIAP